MALPLLGAGIAYAAPEDVWDKVASCESSSRWDINTGNGYFGGLQFAQSTWEEYGGTEFAPRADLATKAEQMAVAEKVLRGQGPGAWPSCGPLAGLGSVREQPRPETAEEKAEQTRKTEKAERAAKAREERKKKGTSYQVVGGDSLSSIADTYELDGGWQEIYDWNRSTVGGDPDLIFPGQRLQLDAPKAEERSGKKAREQRAKPDRPSAGKQKAEQAGHKSVQRAAHQKQERADRAEHKVSGVTAPVSGFAPGTAYRTSGSGWSSGYHTGVDFPVPTGTSVRAVTSGKVVSAGWAGAYGYQVVIRHDDGRYSQYAHLSAISVRSGQPVGGGQRLGRSGSTGNSTGPHLHFEVRTGPGFGTDIDPVAYLRQYGVRI